MSPAQCRIARAAVRLTMRDLARLSDVAHNTVLHFESGGITRPASVLRMQAALTSAGVFLSMTERLVIVAVPKHFP